MCPGSLAFLSHTSASVLELRWYFTQMYVAVILVEVNIIVLRERRVFFSSLFGSIEQQIGLRHLDRSIQLRAESKKKKRCVYTMLSRYPSPSVVLSLSFFSFYLFHLSIQQSTHYRCYYSKRKTWWDEKGRVRERERARRRTRRRRRMFSIFCSFAFAAVLSFLGRREERSNKNDGGKKRVEGK